MPNTVQFRQVVDIQMDINCTPFIAVLFLFCYEIHFRLSLSDNNQADVIEVFNSTKQSLYNFLQLRSILINIH